jgi:hypothetical protein
MLNPYLDKRDFRAVVFRDAELVNIDAVADLFGDDLEIKVDQVADGRIGSGTVSRVRATYYSPNLFLRTADPMKRETVRVGKKSNLFQYEIYILAFRKASRASFMVAVPFSSMAREVFGRIHKRKPSSGFAYLRPTIDQFVQRLIDRFTGSERIKAVGINWIVGGDTGRSDQVVVRGSDVVHSDMFKHLRNVPSGLTLKARRVLLRYEPPGGKEALKIGFDNFGNYSVWVRSEGQNLATTFQLLDVLDRADLIEEDAAFPVRNADDDPIFK